jgi:hypothetical protein
MKLQWATQPPRGGECVDLAGADVISGAFQDKKLSNQFVKDLRAVGIP